MELWVEVEGRGAARLPSGGGDLVAFMSFALSRGFGAQHPLIALADRLAADRRVPLGPLSLFYAGVAEDREDEEKLALAWQDAGPLVESLRGVVEAMEEDPMTETFVRRAGAEALDDEVRELLGVARAAEAAGRRIRLTYRD